MSTLLAASAGDEANNTIWVVLAILGGAALVLGNRKRPKK